MTIHEIGEYAEALFSADNIDVAFSGFEAQVQRLGFDGVLYTYIPELLIDTIVKEKPVYQVSRDYAPEYLTHYQQARYDRDDPLIAAVTEGVCEPIDWSGEICESYMRQGPKCREVIEESRCYGIRNAITLPLMSNRHGIAGASFIKADRCDFPKVLQERLRELNIVTSLYHNHVVANKGFLRDFIKPVFSGLNELELKVLIGLASGKTLANLAIELFRSKKYLEQVLLRIRQKVAGVDESGKPRINRDRLLYYAGLVNIISYADSF